MSDLDFTEGKEVEVRLAATILLLRDGSSGLEVFMVERHHRIDFASSAVVFPGGRVEDLDKGEEIRAHCDGWADEEMEGIRVAAIRETFEESGIMLAERNGAALSAEEAVRLEGYRKEVEGGKISFAECLSREGLRIQCGALRPYARWITPEGMPKRFDTWFFAVEAPEGQGGAHDGRESVDSLWIRPRDALSDLEAGKRQIIFPTKMNLLLLKDCENVGEAFAMIEKRPIVSVCPKMTQEGDQMVLRIPKEAGYPIHEEVFDPEKEGIVRGGTARR